MEHEPYLEEEHKDQLCKKDCKRIAGSLLFYYILLFACAFTLGIISSAYIMSGASQTELETITNIFSMIATCFVTILTLVKRSCMSQYRTLYARNGIFFPSFAIRLSLWDCLEQLEFLYS